MVKVIGEDTSEKLETQLGMARGIYDKQDIIYELRKLKTEADNALFKFQELDDCAETISILGYLKADSADTLQHIKMYLQQNKS